MKFLSLLTAISVLPTLALSLPTTETDNAREGNQPNLNKRARFIIELEPSFDSSLHKRILDSTVNSEVHHQYDHDHFSGLSLSTDDWGEDTVAELRLKPGVKNVWRASQLQRRDSSSFTPMNASAIYNPHMLTGVQELHNRNITGDNIVIGIVGSGIDDQHETLKGKVLQGYNTCKNESLALGNTDYVGLGTLCASVAVGASKDFPGVAQGAKVRMYKVDGCEADTMDQFTDVLIASMLKAYDDKVDIILLTMGIDRSFLQAPEALVASRLAQKVPVVSAAFSTNYRGPYSGFSGAAGEGVIAVAPYDEKTLLTWNATISSSSGASINFTYVSLTGWVLNSNSTFPIVPADNFCSLSNSTDGTGKFVVGKFGERCIAPFFFEMESSRNYSGILSIVEPYALEKNFFFNERGNYLHFDFQASTTQDLLKWMEADGVNNSFKLSFNTNQNYGLITSQIEANSVLMMKSTGPSLDQGFYPHISGPGGYIIGAKSNGSYALTDGENAPATAAAYVAGVIALYLSNNKNVTTKELRNRLISTAEILKASDMYDEQAIDDLQEANRTYSSVLRQGNGRINALAFFDSKISILSEPYLNLNDTDNRIAQHVVTFQNNGRSTVNYRISHSSFDVVYTQGTYGGLQPYLNYDLYSNIVTFSPEEISLGPGEQGNLKVKISAPKELDGTEGPIFSGFFLIADSNLAAVRIPYIGMEFQSKRQAAVTSDLILLGTNINNSFNTTDSPLSPFIYFSLLNSGTTYLSFDIVDENYDTLSYKFPPVAGQGGYHGPILGIDCFFDYKFPLEFASPYTFPWGFLFDSFANGTKIPPGNYNILGRALNIFGDVNSHDDWSLTLIPFTAVSGIAAKPQFCLADDRIGSQSHPSNSSLSSSSSHSSNQSQSSGQAQSLSKSSRSSKGGVNSIGISSFLVAFQLALNFIW